jgi:hypothetical protein
LLWRTLVEVCLGRAAVGRAAKVRGETEELRARQAAAAFLRAARMTDDAAERESLKRRAAQLLAPSEEPAQSAAIQVPERSRAKA